MKLFNKMNKRIQTTRENYAADKARAKKDGTLFSNIVKWIYKLRSVFMAIPVVFAAVLMAIYNSVRLPETVSLCMPRFADGKMLVEVIQISKTLAIFGPLLITAACLVLMFCSRRVAYPWLISVFSLVLPLFVYFASVFPG